MPQWKVGDRVIVIASPAAHRPYYFPDGTLGTVIKCDYELNIKWDDACYNDRGQDYGRGLSVGWSLSNPCFHHILTPEEEARVKDQKQREAHADKYL